MASFPQEQLTSPRYLTGGKYSVVITMTAGTAKLQSAIRTNRVANTYTDAVDIPDSDVAASSTYLIEIGDEVLIPVVTGDAEIYISPIRTRS